MAEKSKPVEIISVDTDTVEKDEAFPQAYAFYVKLSDEPDAVWKGYLLQWENALRSMQRQIRVTGNKLRLVFVYGDNIQSYVKYAAWLVKAINERVEKYNKQVELEEKRDLARQESNQEKKDEIRRKLREL